MLKKIAIWCSLAMLATAPAWTGNGHMLHGVGPVNSSMGGAGAGLFLEPVGALMYNPALLAASTGNQFTFSTEFFKDGVQIEVTLNDGTTGTTHPSNQLGILPAFGWTAHAPGSKWSLGFGLMAIAGFRTDYPEDPDSILFNTPPNGFGRIYTDYRMTKIPIALAYQVTEKLALGFSLIAYVGELAIAPLPFKVYDVGLDENGVPDDNLRYYPQGGSLQNEITFGAQLGFYYTASDKLGVGGSVTTAQNFDPYTWNSTIASPDSPDFGEHRVLEYDLDGPLSATIGLGYVANEKTSIAFDVMYIKYSGVNGFGSPGGVVDRIVYPFGWRNVWAYKAGLEYKASEKLTLRGGYNYSDIPIRGEVVLSATGAPAMFQNHYTAGMGYKLGPVTAEMAFYVVPREKVTGPYPDLDNNVLGSITTSNKLTSALMGLSWKF